MRRLAPLLALALVVAACGDDDTTAATPTPDGTPASSTTAAPDTTVVASTTAPPTTAAPTEAGPTDCLEIWPEATVQAIAGDQFTFFDANPDRSACTYTALPNGIALAWRTGDLADLELSKTGAAVTAPVSDIAICDAGFFTEIQGALLIMEAYSADQQRVFTATISGVDLTDAEAWAVGLLGAAC